MNQRGVGSCSLGGIYNAIIALANPSKMELLIQAKSLTGKSLSRGKACFLVRFSSTAQMELEAAFFLFSGLKEVSQVKTLLSTFPFSLLVC